MRRDILIIKLGALGDAVMATGLIERILRHHAPSRCTLLTSPAYSGLFSSRPELELKTFDRTQPAFHPGNRPVDARPALSAAVRFAVKRPDRCHVQPVGHS